MRKYLYIFVLYPALLCAQISPGELTNAHKDLEGLSNCTKCHVLGEKVDNRKCLECHEEIKSLIEMNKGYHSSKEAKDKDCFVCHGEHFGRDFRILNFDADKFDHNLTTFVLDGKHAKLECKECHKKEFIKDSELKKKKRTYLGLQNDCKSCHKDFHQGELGNDCASCHNTEKFRPASQFDHNNAAYKLTGVHVKTDCEKCHKKTIRNQREFQRFKNIKFESCENCHNDIHKGKFGKDCTKCHVTDSFLKIGNISKFDHDKTDFPLVGKHRNVKCNDCHGSKLSSKPKHTFCIDCHKDYHQGEIKDVSGKVKDCAQCHTVQGFSPSEFTIEDHSKLKFSLDGSHMAVPCVSCHLKNEKWKFKNIGERCADCHDNIHEGFMSPKYSDNGCETCHNVLNWHDVEKFDHSKTDFELTGKHSSTDCSKCHFTELGNLQSQKFKNIGSRCEDCHEDIHFGQFKEGDKTDCAKCHSSNNWKPEKFNHETTNFPLEGAHSKVQCFECHKTVESGSNSYVKYKIEDIRCASCHS